MSASAPGPCHMRRCCRSHFNMQTLAKSLTAGELSDALSRVPRHTPVAIHANIEVNISDCDEDAVMTTYQGQLCVESVRTHINCIELEARA